PSWERLMPANQASTGSRAGPKSARLREQELGGSGFNAPSSFRLGHRQYSTIPQRERPGSDNPGALGMVVARKLSLIEYWAVRHVMFTRMALLCEKLAQGNVATIWRGNIGDGHPLCELNAWKREVPLNRSGAKD